MKRAVHFGAGNIGRGFIGLILHQAGYEVTFVDVNATLVGEIKARGAYTVRLAAPDPQPVTVTGITAVNGTDTGSVSAAIAGADLVTTAVGPNVLRHIAAAIAAGLCARHVRQAPVAIIACENLVGASDKLRELVVAAMPNGSSVSGAVFANCAVDRIVPAQVADARDPLTVTVEPFFEWVIDASAFTTVNPPELLGATFVNDLQPFVERKLFTVNTGHSALAYLGYRAGCRFIHEAMAQPEIRAITTAALGESGAGLVARHGWDPAVHDRYIKKILERFSNPLLPDEVTRVGRSPLRKLGPNDRLIAPAQHAATAGIFPGNLARVVAAALRFDFSDDPEAVELQATLRADGVSNTLTRICGLPVNGALHHSIRNHYGDDLSAATKAPTLHVAGVPASAGFAVGRATILQPAISPKADVPSGDPSEEDSRLTRAILQATLDIGVLRDRTRERLGEAKAEIFDVHISFLKDPEFIGQARSLIVEEGISASAALAKASQTFVEILGQSGDDTLISRAVDLRDVTERLQTLLGSGKMPAARQFDTDVIIIANDLTPSDTVQLDSPRVRGLLTVGGGLNSHSAILARALGLPAIVGAANALAIPDGTSLILNGSTGEVVLNPSATEIEDVRRLQAKHRAEEAALASYAKLPGLTADGRALAIAANVGRLEEISAAVTHGAEGIGLYRSEFSYLESAELPTEEELFHLYRQALEQMAPHPVIIRTLDIGGDKQVPGLNLPEEENPFLGVRGLRLCLERESLFRAQLRALLRASVHGRLMIMLPMVAILEEVRTARRWLAEERTRLEAGGYKVATDIKLGVMIEVPAAALMADQLAREVDFFSIGTNDLVQYTMAADRMNRQLTYLQAAHHPAILQLIKLTVDAAHRHGKWVGLCGEMGSDPLALALLDGLGLDEISLHSAAILRTRAALSRMDHSANVRLAERCLALGSAAEVASVVTAALNN